MKSTATMNEIESLRERERRREPLGEAERSLLTAFYQTLADEETARLAPATTRLDEQLHQQEQAIAQLTRLRDQKRQHLANIESLIRQIQTLEAQEAKVLAATPS